VLWQPWRNPFEPTALERARPGLPIGISRSRRR
jgi:hypothetical protein